MIGRRQMIGTTGLAGLFGAAAPGVGGEQASDRAVADIRTAIDDLRKAIVQPRSFSEIAAVRDQQRTFLRASGKFPDFIDVGINVWFAIYDWHILWQQPVTVTRDAAGRYLLPLVATTVVLRPDLLGDFIGTPYDLK